MAAKPNREKKSGKKMVQVKVFSTWLRIFVAGNETRRLELQTCQEGRGFESLAA